jgi:hypothetical protein
MPGSKQQNNKTCSLEVRQLFHWQNKRPAGEQEMGRSTLGQLFFSYRTEMEVWTSIT